jgi:hypothetical protein
LPNGFYDVIGFYGPQVGSSTNPYHLDRALNCPVIKHNSQYYYLTYRDGDGFIPTMVDSGNSELHLLTGNTLMPIYLNQRDDAHIISNYDRPLTGNIVFDNIDRLYTAYRILHVDVYENYAIERHDSIVDKNNIIDVVDADFILAAQNPDGITILPSEGNVVSLKDFELTFRDNLTAADISMLRKIALYDYNTQNVAIGVDVNSIVYTLGDNRVTFSLLSEITAPSQYFLYIPSGSFTYDNGRLSQMAMFSYTIASQQGGGDIWEFIYSPTQTKTLSKVTMTFVNVASIVGLRTYNTVTVSVGSQSTEYSVGEICDSSGNNVFITLPEPINNNGISTLEAQITFSPNCIHVKDESWNETPITLNIQIVTEDTTLPTNDERYGISIFPNTGEVYEVRYVNLLVKILSGNYGVVSVNEGHSFQDIVVYAGDSATGEPVDSVDNVSIKNQYTDDDGNIVYEYNCVFHNHNKEEDAYTVYIPAELFTITFSGTSGSETVYNPEYTLKYTIKPDDPENEDEPDPNGAAVNFGYRLLMIKGIEGTSPSQVAFRRKDSIFVNRDKFSLAGTCPCLTVTRFDHDNGEAVLSKNTLVPANGDVMDISIRLTYYNNDNIEVSTTSTAEYGIRENTPVITDLGVYFPMLRSSGYPNYMRLTYIFQYNGTELTHELELQFLPEYIYNHVKENPNWKINRRLDLYSGTETDYQWGCMFLTNQYDCILNRKTEKVNEQDPEAEPVVTTHYVAELVPITKVRTGNLEGIYNEKFGVNQPQGYGLYGENVYLTGNFFLNNGKSLMDISDDILLATGDINELQDGLKNLDTSVRATIEALTLRQETFEHGLDTSIKNYISTNKNAVLKIGLDYSLWSLGSAGISMVNPNATYDFDPISGNYTVNADTVGDGDEYIALQGSKIQFSTYKNEWVTVGDGKEEYIAVICSTISPEIWSYPGSIYDPRIVRSGAQAPVVFFLGYVKRIPTTVNHVAITDSTTEFLKYVMFQSTGIVDDNNFSASTTVTANSEYYSFSSYYLGTPGEPEPDFKVKLHRVNSETGKYEMINATSEIGDNTTIYFVPRVVTAGMFKDGKFNADFIEAKSLVAVDVDTQEVTSEPELDDEGQPKTDEGGNTIYKTISKYKRNPRFNPLIPISSTNYPVLKNDGTDAIDKEANFVVVSGATGKISARGANISGTIIVGDDDEELQDTNYLLLSDGKNSDKSYAVLPGMYITSRSGGKEEVVAKFNGTTLTNPLSSFERSATWGSVSDSTSQKTATYKMSYNETRIPYSNGGSDDGGVTPFNPYLDDEPYRNTRSISGNSSGSSNYWTQWTTWFTLRNGSSDSWTIPLFTTETDLQNETDSYASIVVPPKTNKTINIISGTCNITLSVSLASQAAQKNPHGTANVYFRIYDEAGNDVGSVGYNTVTVNGNNSASADPRNAYINYPITLYNQTNSNKTYKFKAYISVGFSASNSNGENNKTAQRPSYGDATLKVTTSLTNFQISMGQESFSTEVFGNGLIVGYNDQNYFTTYFKAGENTTSSRMITEWKAAGGGMQFDNGAFSYYLFNRKIPAFITILKGKVYKNKSSQYSGGGGYYYYFDGFSALSPYYSNSFYTYKTSSHYWCSYVPYISNYLREPSGMWWWYKKGEDNRGRVYNSGSGSLTSPADGYFACTYNSALDIFIIYAAIGSVVIAFGEKWNSLFVNRKAFMYDYNIKVSAVGIGKGDEWGGGDYSENSVPFGSLFTMVKPPFVNEAGITGAGGVRLTLYKVGGEESDTVTYNGTKTNQPLICNAIQVDLADDSSFNDGAFYITIDLCPNNMAVGTV